MHELVATFLLVVIPQVERVAMFLDEEGQKYLTKIDRNKPGGTVASSAQPRLFLSVAYRWSEAHTPELECCQSPEPSSHQPPVTRCLNPS